ncbi:nickel-dependent lactate racemase [Anaerospora hongkongensis]|uniref:nickel-dependent lactate racemase n=3 Tax=Anaerospora hongkongensis TaxID=244830 RepID=UPI00289AF84A|nr:nickel-dependent lactate racemase [Anaerospora hongkongensis]
MAIIKIPYAKSFLQADIPDERLIAVLESKAHTYKPADDEAQLVKMAMENPIGSARLRDLAKDKQNIVIIASDHTRPVPSRIIAPLMLKEIRSGNPDADITFLIATGFHRATTKAELIEKFGETIVNNEKISIHDCRDDGRMVNIGKLPSGGDLVINKLAVEADLLIAEGFIEPHFFAGFSGGRKSVLPGIASEVTVLANHCAKFIASDKACAGNLQDNPLHLDMLFAARQAKLAYIVNVVIDAEKKIIQAFAGDFNLAHEKGCEVAGRLAAVKAAPADIVITSNGGYPLDQNIYQAVKGMSAAEATVKSGGVIIICAACNDGHGGEDFFYWFAKASGGAQEVWDNIMRLEACDTIADQWEAQILARIQLKAQVILVTDQCDHSLIETFGMKAANTLAEAIEIAESIVGKKAMVTVIPDGVSVIVQDS